MSNLSKILETLRILTAEGGEEGKEDSKDLFEKGGYIDRYFQWLYYKIFQGKEIKKMERLEKEVSKRFTRCLDYNYMCKYRSRCKKLLDRLEQHFKHQGMKVDLSVLRSIVDFMYSKRDNKDECAVIASKFPYYISEHNPANSETERHRADYGWEWDKSGRTYEIKKYDNIKYDPTQGPPIKPTQSNVLKE